MKGAVLVSLLCCATVAAAQSAPAAPAVQPAQSLQQAQPHQPQQAQAEQPAEGFVVVHVPPQRSPDAQRIEERCVRTTASHAAIDRDSRQTKGTQGTHGECAGRGFRGDGGADILSGLQSPATTR